MRKVYLDNNATTAVAPEVLEAMLPFYRENFGNPSSIHCFGREVRVAIDEAREKVAVLLGAAAEEIVFTGSGTEADNLAIKGSAYALRTKGQHIITCRIEHPAVLNTCKQMEKEGFKVTYLSVDKYGMIRLEELAGAITDETILITIIHANNEIGTIQPIAEIGRIAKERDIRLHTDAVQSAGKVATKVEELGVDLLSLSAHKIHGPKGIGALYVKKGLKLQPILHGGHQEGGQRSGTENAAGIVALGKACQIAAQRMAEDAKTLVGLRDRLFEGLQERIPKIKLNGHPTNRLPTTLNCSFYGIEGESLLMNLDLAGVAVSTGSACSSGSIQPSHVLLSLGLSPQFYQGSLRFSVSRYNSQEDIDYILEILPPIVERLRKMSPFWKE
jgi:cysteine desulfurase